MQTEVFKKPLPYLALLIAHLIWGANFVFSKLVLNEMPVMTLGFLRFGLACLLIAPFLIPLESTKKRVKLEHIPKLIIISMLMVTFNIALFYNGLKLTSAIDASVISLSLPVLSIIAGWWFLKEKIYTINLLGIGIGFLGALLILGVPLFFFVPGTLGSEGQESGSGIWGNMLIFSSTICSVWGMLLSRQMLKYYSPLVITGCIFLFGALAFLVPAIVEYFQNPSWVNQITPVGIIGLLFIVLLSSISAYFLHMWGLSKVELSHANLFQNVEPAIAATLAVPLLGERISFSFIIATCMIVLGVYWATLGKQEHHHLPLRHHRH